MSSSTNRGKHGRLLSCLDVLFLLLLGVYLLLGMTRAPFHGDESTFLRMSLDWAYVYEDHAPEKVMYRADPGDAAEEQSARVLNGSINPLTIGIAWTVAGRDRSEINGFWVWYSPDGDEWAYNRRLGNMPDASLLDIARIPSTLFTAGSIVFVFFIALGLSRSRPAAWLAAFLYASTPAVLINGRRAMQEGAMLFFTSLAVLAAVHLLRQVREGNLQTRRIVLGFGGLGAAAGLASASKHNSLLIIAPVYLAVLLLVWWSGKDLPPQQEKTFRFVLTSAWFASALLGLACYYLLMPVWWIYGFHWLILLSLSALCFSFVCPSPGRRIWGLRAIPVVLLFLVTVLAPRAWSGIYRPILISLEARQGLMPALLESGGELPTWQSRIREMADQLLAAGTQYYESGPWGNQEEELAQIRVYESARLDGRGGGLGWGAVVSLLIAAGLAAVLFFRRGWETFFLLLWLAFPAAGLLLTNPLAWQRYYLVLLAPWSVLAGFAVLPLTSGAFAARLRERIQRHKPHAGPVEKKGPILH